MLTTPRLAALCLLLAAAPTADARDAERSNVNIPAGAATTAPEQKLSNRSRSFVPLHSTLIGHGGVTRLNFSGALSIHNASATNVLAIDRIDYRNGAGEIVETYVTDPVYLKPFASMQIAIAQDDTRAGVGASFTVDWSTPPGGDEPIVEAVMAAFVGTHSYSFLSASRRVARPQ